MKKSIIALIIFAVIFGLIVSYFYRSDTPTQTVLSFFDNIKDAKLNDASKYILKSNNEYTLEFTDEFEENLYKSLFSKIDYEILSSTQNGNQSTVKVKINSCDFTKIYDELKKSLYPSVVATSLNFNKAKNKTDKIILKSILGKISSKDSPMTSNTIEISLQKHSNGWLIEPSSEFMDALSGNLYSTLKNARDKVAFSSFHLETFALNNKSIG